MIFFQIMSCLEGITDYYKANASAHWILSRLPKGIDKLKISR